MIKLIHISLSPEEFLPVKPLIDSIPYTSMTKDVSLRITSYLSAVAMMKHGILPEDLNKPKELANLRIDFDLRKQKFTYKATLVIELPEEILKEEERKEDDQTISFSPGGDANL